MPVRAVPASVVTVHQVNALTDNEASSDAEVGCPCRVGNGTLFPRVTTPALHRSTAGSPAEISMESLILAQDERWRRA
jgi:hypothetical protein